MCDIGLYDIICQRGNLSESETKKIMSQLLKALNHCHSMGIVHRDIKSQNIMIVFLDQNCNQTQDTKGVNLCSETSNEELWNIKLIDWGIACKLKEGAKLNQKSGSPYYMAPEVIQGLYDNKCDVWSCGILMYNMLTGSYPFKGDSVKDLFWNIKSKVLDFENDFWSRFTPECISFLK